MTNFVGFFLALLVLLPFSGNSQVITSNGSGGGAWNSTSTWAGGVIPNSGNSTQILILSGDIVNIPAGVTIFVDQTIVESGATLRVDASGVLQVENGSGFDLRNFRNGTNGMTEVSGMLVLQNDATIGETNGATNSASSAVTLKFLNGGLYRHAHTTSRGIIPIADWQAGSTIEITSYTSNSGTPVNLEQNFHHFVWNCPDQEKVISLAGRLTSVLGNFSVLSTGPGASKLRLFDGSDNNLTVGGNFLVSGSSSLRFFGTGNNNTFTINGNFTDSSDPTYQQLLLVSGDLTMNIAGNFTANANSYIRFESSGSGIITMNLEGNFRNTGSIATSPSGSVQLNFSGSEPQLVTGSGSVVNNFHFHVLNGAILDLGNSFLSGSGSFTLHSGGELRAGAYPGNGTNSSGALQNSTIRGNLRVPAASRIFEPGSTIMYNGNGIQHIGTGHPQTAGVNLTINNPNGVNLIKNQIISGELNFMSGPLNASTFNLTFQGSVWNDPNGDFNPQTGTVTFTDETSILSNQQVSFNNLALTSTAEISLEGNIEIAGNLNATAGAVVNSVGQIISFTGGGDQTLSLNNVVLTDISVNKAGGVVNLTSVLPLAGSLSIISATTVNSNGFLQLLSTNDSPTQDGRIGTLPLGAAIVGDVTVNRFMSAEGNFNRFLSSPVVDASVSDWQDDFPITGAFTGSSNGCPVCPGGAGPSMHFYNEPTPGRSSNGYVPFPVSDNTEILQVGLGYTAYMWDSGQITWDLTGEVNQGSIPLPVTRTNSGNSGDGWNIVGNPFPSAILWDNGDGWTKTGIAPTVYVSDEATGMFRGWNANTQVGDLSSGTIATGQGFWVYAENLLPALTVHESAKTNTAGSFYREKNEQAHYLQLSLVKDNLRDNLFLVQHPQASRDFDDQLDSRKLLNSNFSLLVKDKNGNDLSMVAQNEFSSDDIINLEVHATEAGTYAIEFNSESNFSHREIYLVDVETGVYLLQPGSSFDFELPAQSVVSDRFYLAFNEYALQQKKHNVQAFPNPFNSHFKVEHNTQDTELFYAIYTLNGVETERGSLSDQLKAGLNLNKGMYILKVWDHKGPIANFRIIKN